jgi:hypothetical protein
VRGSVSTATLAISAISHPPAAAVHRFLHRLLMTLPLARPSCNGSRDVDLTSKNIRNYLINLIRCVASQYRIVSK